MKEYKTDLLIIGAGPVGIFSVYQAGFLGIKTITVDALDEIGGQPQALYPKKTIADIPAFKSIKAEDLIKNLKEQADQFENTYLMSRKVTSLKQIEDNLFEVCTSKEDKIIAKTVLIASGAGAFDYNKPPLDNIEVYEKNNQVHYAVKEVDIFKNQEVVIAGGGDSAVDWALELQGIAKKIYVVHRRDSFRAAASNVDKMKQIALQSELELVIPYMLDYIEGENGILTGVGVKTLKGDTRLLKCSHLLSFFGLARSLGFLEDSGFNVNKLNSSVEVTPSTFETNIKGVFAAGDIAHYEHKLKLISVGFAEAAGAIHHAWKYIFPDKVFHFIHSTAK